MKESSYVNKLEISVKEHPLCLAFYLESFQDLLEAKERTLKDGGMTQEEFNVFAQKGYLEAALYYLRELQSYKDVLCVECNLKDFWRCFGKSGKSLTDIGMTSRKLNNICKINYLEVALWHLEKLKSFEDPHSSHKHLTELRNFLGKSGKHLSALGINKKTLQKICKENERLANQSLLSPEIHKKVYDIYNIEMPEEDDCDYDWDQEEE